MPRHSRPRRRRRTLRRGVFVRALRLTSVAAGAAAVLACTAFHPPPTTPGYASFAGALAADRSLHGVWYSSDYGWILSLDEQGVEVFHDLGDLCLPDRGEFAGIGRYRLSGSDRLSLLHLDLGDRGDRYEAPKHFRRLATLPAACRADAAAGAIELPVLYDLVGELFARYYPAFEPRAIDWRALRRAHRAEAEAAGTPDELFTVLTALLDPLADGHVGLWLGEDRFASPSQRGLRRRLERLWRDRGAEGTAGAFVSSWHRRVHGSVIPSLVADSHREAAAGAVEWGRLTPAVGYLRINRFSRIGERGADRATQLDRLDAAMEAALADLGDSRTLVVDVSMNGGGFDAAALTVAGRFADQPRLAYTIAPTTSGRAERLFVEPAAGRRYAGPVKLLTSEITASAAEAFVLAMRALPNVEHVGEPTRGSLSGILPKPLPHGFRVKMAGQIVLDASGEHFEGRGIPPHRRVTVFDDDVENGLAAALRSLAAPAAR